VRLLIERAIPERPDLWEAMLARQRVHYGAHCLDRTVLYPGVADTLEALCAAGWRLAVVTNKPGPVTRPILEGLGIARFFGAVVGGGDTPALKPDPAPLRLAASGWASRWTLTTGWRVTILPTLRPAGAPAPAPLFLQLRLRRTARRDVGSRDRPVRGSRESLEPVRMFQEVRRLPAFLIPHFAVRKSCILCP
jgi:hypothetical protein